MVTDAIPKEEMCTNMPALSLMTGGSAMLADSPMLVSMVKVLNEVYLTADGKGCLRVIHLVH
jgi:hypothetical protein